MQSPSQLLMPDRRIRRWQSHNPLCPQATFGPTKVTYRCEEQRSILLTSLDQKIHVSGWIQEEIVSIKHMAIAAERLFHPHIHGSIGSTTDVPLPTTKRIQGGMPFQQLLGAVRRTSINHQMLQGLTCPLQNLPGTHNAHERVGQGICRLQAGSYHRYQRRRHPKTRGQAHEQLDYLSAGK